MGLFSNKNESREVWVQEKQLKCPVCTNTRFFYRKAQLNSAVASFFDLDWMNKSATCFVCSNCSFISWFLKDIK